MSLFNPDPDSWYTIVFGDGDGSSIQTWTSLSNGKAAAYVSPTYDPVQENHQFQFIPAANNSNLYIIRNRVLGANNCLSPALCATGDKYDPYCGINTITVTECANSSVSWSIPEYDSTGSYYLASSQLGDGNDWRLNIRDHGPAAGSWLNLTTLDYGLPAEVQRCTSWNLTKLDPIDYSEFPAYASLPAFPVIPNPTEIAQAPQSDDEAVGNSSTPIGAIVGGVVGGVVALAVILAALFFVRRRRQKRSFSPDLAYETDTKQIMVEGPGDLYYTRQPVEAPESGQILEAPSDAAVHELDGGYVAPTPAKTSPTDAKTPRIS